MIRRPFRTAVTRVASGVLASAVALVTLTACAGYREDVCSEGEYPVLSVGGTGSACVSNGEQPPAGFARYPEGKVPRQVDDKWDKYWNTHTLDKKGNIIDAG
ncbi:hypothetical protein AB0C51_00555 [Streptomyces pathocidini]|uniref:SCO0607 family lipoprotein n=1 Tax=Streptomyces pathocidini TaxID=1650571 RepID=A0ABW7UM61_9ACTN|nr:hypothetical protein [Streptomyces pathocidini]